MGRPAPEQRFHCFDQDDGTDARGKDVQPFVPADRRGGEDELAEGHVGDGGLEQQHAADARPQEAVAEEADGEDRTAK